MKAAVYLWLLSSQDALGPPTSGPAFSSIDRAFNRERKLAKLAGDPLDRTHPIRDLGVGILRTCNMMFHPVAVGKARHLDYLLRRELADAQRAREEKLRQAASARAAQQARAARKEEKRKRMSPEKKND